MTKRNLYTEITEGLEELKTERDPVQEDYSPCLYDMASQYISKDHPPVKRIIVTAASRMPDGLLLVGARHWDDVMRAQFKAALGDRDELDYAGKAEQGFIDQYGQFIDRVDAYYIARKNEQPLIGKDFGKLYSENLH